LTILAQVKLKKVGMVFVETRCNNCVAVVSRYREILVESREHFVPSRTIDSCCCL